METQFTAKEKKKIHEEIRKKYRRAARNPDGLFQYPTGRSGLEKLGYIPDLIATLPESAAAAYRGVGNLFAKFFR